MTSNSVERVIDLLKQVQNSVPFPCPDEWVGFSLIEGGKVKAGKNIRENPQTYSQVIGVFDPLDQWIKVAQTLDVQNKFRQAYTSLSDEEMAFFKQKVRDTMTTIPSSSQK